MTKKLDTSHAIATAYRNFEFRSRLEAKWAVFFDLCGWRWSYEPIDCNGWIPDFAIGHRPTLVEVKPFWHFEDFAEARFKIAASGYVHDVLLLGCDPTWRNDQNTVGAPPIGWLDRACSMCDYYAKHPHFDGADIHEEERNRLHGGRCPRTDDEVHFGLQYDGCKPSLCTLYGAWENIIDGSTGKPARVWLQDPVDVERELIHRWAEACNVSQWVPVNANRKRTAIAS